jgi:glycoprotease/Kae1 family metallohydrolase
MDDSGKVMARVIDMYRPPEGWGIHPAEAAQHHEKVKQDVLARALEEAGIELKGIDLIAYSQGPGLAPCLHKGLNFAKSLSERTKKPLIGVNHCIAHIEIGRQTTELKDPITLYVSGANTQVLGLVSGRYRCFGETMDIGIGNALDKFGRGAGMGFPAGPRIEELARKGKYIELPYVVKGMDLSFSGIVTSALNKMDPKMNKGEKAASLEDMCFSIQETLFAMLTEVTERALAHTGKNEVLLTGGVAANQRLSDMLRIMCEERGAKFACVDRKLSGDNGAMIAWQGIIMAKAGMKTDNSEVLPRQRTDDVDVKWI